MKSVYPHMLLIVPQTMSTLKGSYGRSWGRCLIRVLNLFTGVFLFKFPHKISPCDMYMCISTAQHAESYLQIQAENGSYDMSMCMWNHFDYAGSQNMWVAVSGSIWGMAVSFHFLRKMALVTCPCAF